MPTPLTTLEFNDRAVTLGDGDGIIMGSPGFALLNGDNSLQLGEVARRQARLHPTGSYDRFWHELSLQPVAKPVAQPGNGLSGGGLRDLLGSLGGSSTRAPRFRHYADLAYAHLCHIAEAADFEGEAVFAVPGSFSREQLAILLGLAARSPIRPHALIDSALAAASGRAIKDGRAIRDSRAPVVYADLQLHQTLLSLLAPVDGSLRVMEAVPVAGRGSLNFIERLMQLATTEFIRQCRYNPQHNAESEQHLYDLLEQQLMQGGGSMTLEIKSAEQVHSAKISQASLLQALGEDYQAIDKHLQALVRGYSAGTAQPRLLLSPALAVLPGLTASLSHEAEVLDEAALHRNCAALASLFPKVADSGSSGNNSETARAFNLITEVPHGG